MSSSDDDFTKAQNSARGRKRPRTISTIIAATAVADDENSKKKLCHLCQKESIPDMDQSHQQLLEYDSLRAHYFCLLFSSGLGQSGTESEGLHGFLPVDVRRELKRGSRLKCVYCKKKGATVGCAKQQCKKSYHLPCGMENNSLNQFFDQFKSYCSSHRPTQKMPNHKQNASKKSNDKCSICQDKVVARPGPASILAKCCSSWFHRKCIQKMALSFGAPHFKCPLCANQDQFSKEMQEFGIYLPQKDASWELEGRFDTDVNRIKTCGAKVCFCDKEQGRKYNFPDGIWELLNCHACGSTAIHVKCGGLEEFVDPQWDCYLCRRIVRSEEETRKRKSRPINEIWGTALARKPKANSAQRIMAYNTLPNSTNEAEILLKTPLLINGKMEISNTVTITPIPKNSVKKPQHFPMKSESNRGVEIRMVVPIVKESHENKSVDKISEQKQHSNNPSNQDTIRLSLEDIINAGLNKKPRETNYQCTKAFADLYDQPRAITEKRRSVGQKRASLDTEQGSPGDSDYESAQEGLPFKIRKQGHIPTSNSTKKSLPCPLPKEKSSSESDTAADKIDLKIQKSIKDFFQAIENSR